MPDTHDDLSLIPTDLDLIRLTQMGDNDRVESENETWVVLSYPTSPEKSKPPENPDDPAWCMYSLVVNCPGVKPIPGTYECKTVKDVRNVLQRLEDERTRKRKKD